jgi:sulfopyruvate decarboxylase TPP-binding subunit
MTQLTTPIHPERIFAAIRAAGATHVVTVPDTHQRTLLRVLAQQSDVGLVSVCTEDEVLGINLGLYMGGRRPLLLMQNTGFYASLNSMRGICLDAKVPACLLIGEHGRDSSLPSKENRGRTVNLLEPTLELWRIPYYRLDFESDLGNISTALERAWESRGPVAVIVGSPTGEG